MILEIEGRSGPSTTLRLRGRKLPRSLLTCSLPIIGLTMPGMVKGPPGEDPTR
jgi:hypothetical protein